MKQTPHDKELEANLAKGFLGDDTRDAWEIVAADDIPGIDHARIALRLSEILVEAMAHYGNPVDVGEHLSAVYREAMGRIPCPWPHCGLAPKGEVELTDLRSGNTVLFSPLSVHLIAEHGFFQGRGSRYRMEPAELVRMLDISPENEQE
jgi:hypothetical protein